MRKSITSTTKRHMILKKYGVSLPEKSQEKKSALQSYSFTQYALKKRLPKEWLSRECGLSTKHDRYHKIDFLKIPYLNEEEKEVTFRKRFAHKEFRWKRNSVGKIGLYGEWKLPSIRQSIYGAVRPWRSGGIHVQNRILYCASGAKAVHSQRKGRGRRDIFAEDKTEIKRGKFFRKSLMLYLREHPGL